MGSFGSDSLEELTSGFHIPMSNAPAGGQPALNSLLQDSLLELGKERLLMFYFILRNADAGTTFVDLIDQAPLLGWRWEIHLVI
jgi:hypothetical protein